MFSTQTQDRKRTYETVVITNIDEGHENGLGTIIYFASLADGRVVKTHLSPDDLTPGDKIDVVMIFDGYNYFMKPSAPRAKKERRIRTEEVKEFPEQLKLYRGEPDHKKRFDQNYDANKWALNAAARLGLKNPEDVIQAAIKFRKFLIENNG